MSEETPVPVGDRVSVSQGAAQYCSVPMAVDKRVPIASSQFFVI